MSKNKSIKIELTIDDVTVKIERDDAWFGGNPLYHAKEFNIAASRITDEIEQLLIARFGDIRNSDK